MKNLTLSQACEGMILYKTAVGKSHHTIRNYRNSMKKLQLFFKDDPRFASITRKQLVDFFLWLQEEYVSEPDGAAPRGKIKLAPKSILNVHTNLSALWHWAVDEGVVEKNLVRTIDKPAVSPRTVIPLTKDEIGMLLKACGRTRTWKTRAETSNARPTVDRDIAIILLLLDTGIRAAELCSIQIVDLDLKANSVLVRGKGPGKGKKERTVHFGKRTARALWRMLTPRLPDARDDDTLFVAGQPGDHRPLTRDVLGRLLRRLGERAGVNKVHPHRFRHTFAINYLRNEGDVFTLQSMLGHTDLAMVQHYTQIAQTDCANAHRRASPVDNWKL